MRIFIALLLATFMFPSVVFGEESERDKAISLVKKAAALIKEQGVEKATIELNNPEGAFVEGELYVFSYDTTGTMVTHPKNAKLIGKNLIDVPDVDGKLFRKEIITIALEKGTGWVDYKYKNPTTSKVEEKTTYVEKVSSLVLCCGVYK